MGRVAAGITAVAYPTRRVLLLRRSPLVPSPGLWSCPAGGVEPGEGTLAAAYREFREETGYSGALEVVRHVASPRFHHFVAVCSDEFRPHLNWENDMAGWFAKNYHPVPLHSGMRKVLADL